MVLRLARVWISSSWKSLGCGDMNLSLLRPEEWSLSISLRRAEKGVPEPFGLKGQGPSAALRAWSWWLRPYEFTV